MSNQITTMSEISTSVTVSMEDVVNVFISQYEDGLIEKRKVLQQELTELSKQVKVVVDGIKLTAKQTLVEQVESLNKLSSSLMSFEFQMDEDVTFNSDDKLVGYYIQSTVKVEQSKSRYNQSMTSKLEGYVVVSDSDVEQYKLLMDQKAEVNRQLMDINNELKDISRKERKVRGIIAERKIQETGMADLLQDQQLLQLIQIG